MQCFEKTNAKNEYKGETHVFHSLMFVCATDIDHNPKNSVQLPLDLKLFFCVSQINLNLLFPPWFAGETEPTLFERASQCFDDHNVSQELTTDHWLTP
jgi:hypothetical protein